ncbi:hypothetical protein M0R45_023744 [Rubus argutus]|uniref:Uncharacterized protein n=1 Tax=Rubus argutus TaxID=59490 RepID=A0AAW1WQG2_RUBAR
MEAQKPIFSFTVLGDEDLSDSSVNVRTFLSPLPLLARSRILRQIIWGRRVRLNLQSHVYRQVRSPLIVSDRFVTRARVITSVRSVRHPFATSTIDGWFTSECSLDGVPAGLVWWIPASLLSITGVLIYRHELHTMACQLWSVLSSRCSSVSSYRQLVDAIQNHWNFVTNVLRFFSANRQIVEQIYDFLSLHWEFVKLVMLYAFSNWEFLEQTLEIIARNRELVDFLYALIVKFFQCLSALWRGSNLYILSCMRLCYRRCRLFPSQNGIGLTVIFHPRYEGIRTLHRSPLNTSYISGRGLLGALSASNRSSYVRGYNLLLSQQYWE